VLELRRLPVSRRQGVEENADSCLGGVDLQQYSQATGFGVDPTLLYSAYDLSLVVVRAMQLQQIKSVERIDESKSRGQNDVGM
jgi:hypothetical protein